MNNQDREDILELKIEAKNSSKQLERLVTNHVPHVLRTLGEHSGQIRVITLLALLILGLVVGLYFE